MAVTVTVRLDRADLYIADIIATADADTVATLNHNMNLAGADIAGNPGVEITIQPLIQAPAAVSAWASTAIAPNTVTMTKGTGVGSGNAGAQVRVAIKKHW